MRLSSLEKTDLLLLLLYSKGRTGRLNEPVVGITRLMKLLFLLSKTAEVNQFTFEPYKMGPFSSEVYPELDFLQNFPTPAEPFVETGEKTTSDITPENLRLIQEMSEEDASLTSEEINKPFRLTDLGAQISEEIWKTLESADQQHIERLKTEYGNLNLRDLLKYVYVHYPDMTTKSEIKDQIL